MKNRLLCIGAIAFLAGAMAVAQNNSQDNTDTQQGSTATTPEGTAQTKSDIPGGKEGQTEKGSDKQGNPDEARPGSMGAPSTPNTGTAPQGETPATGSQTEQKGTTDENDTRPGSSPTTAPDNNQNPDQSNNNGTGNPPKTMSSDTSMHAPDYAKPIDQTQDKSAPSSDSGETNTK